MQWNMEVQPTSNYSLGMALQVYVKLGHVDLIGDLQLEIRNRSHWPIWFPKDLLTGMDLKSTPGHGNSIPLPTPFAESEVGNFHHL